MSREKFLQYMRLLGQAMVAGLVSARHRSRSGEAGGKGVKGRQGYLYNDGIYWGVRNLVMVHFINMFLILKTIMFND